MKESGTKSSLVSSVVWRGIQNMFHIMFIQGTMIDFEHFMLQSRLYNIYCIIILRGPAYIWLNNSLKKAYTRQKT